MHDLTKYIKNYNKGVEIMEQYKEASNGVIYPKGEKMPEMFSKYFIGEAYLNMLVL